MRVRAAALPRGAMASSGTSYTDLKYGKTKPVYAFPSDLPNAVTTCPKLPDRPARVQVEQKRALQQTEHLGEYNIWYGKYMGENSHERAPKAATRVCIETDAGLTRADYTSATSWLCLHFARGDCVYGKDCTYRHSAPTEEDESLADAPHDVFGRNRHASWRDDMGGTGTWNKECKTLYVGRLYNIPKEETITETVVRHFSEFGPLESVRVLKSRGCAFVTYKLRATAEFAKEAMAEQGLDNDEQINVRWAYDDPNPRAQAMKLRNNAQMMLAAMEAKGHLPPGTSAADLAYPDDGSALFDGEGGGGEPSAKRQRGDAAPMTREEYAKAMEEEAMAAEAEAAKAAEAQAEAEEAAKHEQAANAVSHLDAILNKIGGSGGSGGGGGGGDSFADFLKSVDAGGEAGGAAPAAAAASSSTLARDNEVDLPPGVHQPKGLPEGWAQYSDPTTGHPYYVGPSGESTWRRP